LSRGRMAPPWQSASEQTGRANAWGAVTASSRGLRFGTAIAESRAMTRPRRSTPGIAFAADRAGRFQSTARGRATEAAKRQTLDIVAVGRRIETARRTRRAACIVGGAVLVGLAVAARGVIGAALALGGVALIARGAGGQPLGAVARGVLRQLRSRAEDDRVNQASWESFPASDPPAHSPGKG
jgi:hypothetical protein